MCQGCLETTELYSSSLNHRTKESNIAAAGRWLVFIDLFVVSVPDLVHGSGFVERLWNDLPASDPAIFPEAPDRHGQHRQWLELQGKGFVRGRRQKGWGAEVGHTRTHSWER